MIGDQVVSSYDPKVFGKWDHVAVRWRHIVDILDHFLPDWHQGENRETSGSLGIKAAQAIGTLARERGRLKEELAEFSSVPKELVERARDGDPLGQANRFLQIHAEIKRHDEEFFSGSTWEGDDSSVNRMLQLVRGYFRQRDAIADLQGQLAHVRAENQQLRLQASDSKRAAPSRFEVVYHPQNQDRDPYVCRIRSVSEYGDGRVKLHVEWPGIAQRGTPIHIVPYRFNKIEQPATRFEGKAPELAAPYGNCQPHPDAPSQNLSGEVTYPAWATSYTKRVVGELHDAWMSPEVPFNERLGAAIVAATALLKDYHQTQHEVYEQRDAALEQVKDLESKLRLKQAFLKLNRDARYEAVQDVAKLRVKLQKVREILDQTEAAA